MSDFMPRDMLPDLWDEILKRHWTYLDTDGSIQKIEEGKKLENCLKEFLCIVTHDRKFFLPETDHVLRKSIRKMDEFNAYKAIIGFRSISNYANNLFTKPWRKEYRVLKMYSGFYQHEIKSNLLDAEKLFEAMGYRQVSEEILVLDGPICPDQVTNVSRDAMAAYVECQIMEHIYSGLLALGITCSWQDIFHYREKFIGGTSQAINGLGYVIQEKQMRKEKLINIDNCYASIQQSPQTFTTPECANCSIYNRIPPQSQYGIHSDNHGTCTIHGNNGNSKMPSYPIAGYQQPHQVGYGLSSAGMQHSRSLEHYSEPVPQLPHRHSFDHQQKGCTAHHYKPSHQLPSHHVYESPYDCLDGASMGGSSVSYAAVVASGGGSNNAINNCGMNSAYSHPYNVSGNRYPLPYNISNQLNTQYVTPNVTCNGIKNDPYNNTDNSGYASVSKPHNYNYQQPPLPPIRQSSVVAGGKDFHAYRQRSFPPDQQLIEFDDRAPLKSHDFHAQLHALPHCNAFDYDRERNLDQQRRFSRGANIPTTYTQPKDIMTDHQYVSHAGMVSAAQYPSSDDMYGNYAYARPLPKAERLKNNSSANISTKQERNSNVMDVLDNNDKHLQLQQMEMKDNAATLNGMTGGGSKRKISSHTNEVSDLSYGSNFDDFETVDHGEQRSPTQASKNQDGVGSYESWSYVFQNLERAGYSKDLDERGDLLVQGLNLDSMNLSNGGGGSSSGPKTNVEKRRSNQVDATKSGRHTNNEQNVAPLLDKSGTSTAVREGEKRDEKKSGVGCNKQEKSILKPQPVKKTKSGLKHVVPTPAYDNNNSNNEKPSERNIRPKTRKPSAAVLANTQPALIGQNEWSCRFCTFINPDSRRVCEICCRSKDLNPEAVVSHTPTCV